MSVCLSVTGLQLKYTSLGIAYLPAAHNAIAMEIEVGDLEDRRRRQKESRCMEDG